ncbi:hypothetical protein SARC_05032 [Sphaeroforma arctica JP610]|uniref:RING-type domain-containing protein n=1 Tax=Sphaeroforma arctica JP610 TaxID=667725 RepID=A0A0L0G3C9_9EUKA|nr:hypothetical protein SARC_05032 [Sphaeroforma arctica JP610]KNC82693.1 hypothetical protein SARC_05032 [Sphaeroforma arctica JP610]|eukprot:XP_014156595.1 hypothetical protein SARC_05032 [Sphaeroforma arctica JP610]
MPVSFLFIDKSFNVKCALCRDIPIDACDTRCCGSVYCARCINNLSLSSSSSKDKYCPACSAPISTSDVSENFYLRKRVDELEVSCDTCGESGIRSQMREKHTEAQCRGSRTANSNYVYPPTSPAPYTNTRERESTIAESAPPAYESLRNDLAFESIPTEANDGSDQNAPEYGQQSSGTATDGAVTVSKGSYFMSILRSAWSRIAGVVETHRATKKLRREQANQNRAEKISRCKQKVAAMWLKNAEGYGSSSTTIADTSRGKSKKCQRAQRKEAKWARKHEHFSKKCYELLERNDGDDDKRKRECRYQRRWTRKANRCARKQERWCSRIDCRI